MATREELESQAADCADAAAYAALARKALEEPADLDYAKELLGQGEMSCSFPADYLRIAEVTAAAGDKDKAAALYEEAEGMCFEAKEKAEVGYSLALHLGDKDKGRELIEAAIAETKDTGELLSYAAYIKEALEDEKLADSLFAKVTGDCKSIEDFQNLAGSIKEEGGEAAARLVYQKAADITDGIEDIARFAQGISELFGDKDWVAKVLGAAEGDCMFPGQFVALAGGYQKLLDDRDKAAELLEQGKEFAMSGQENLDLANGYAGLLEDRETAKGLYEQALADLTTKDELLTLAGDIARHMEDKTLALAAYDKAQEKLSAVADYYLLAQAVNDELGDKDKVAQIYEAVEAKLETSADLVALAAEVGKNLADADQTQAIYRKALDNSKSYTDTVKIMDAFAKSPADAELTGQLLGKALELAEDNAQLLDIAQRGAQLMADDKQRVMEALDKAEENVGSLDEMRKLSSAVKKFAADDEARMTRVAEKLEKREASQARYVEFQNQEKGLTRANQFMELADTVMAELDDVSYATQLLGRAEELMRENPYNLSQFLPFLEAVDKLAGDQAWTDRLLEEAAGHCEQFPQVKALGETAARKLKDADAGREWTRKLYTDWIGRLDASQASAFEYLKIARAIKQHLGDAEWAEQALESAAGRAESHFHFAFIGELADLWGNAERAQDLYAKAADACQDPGDYQQLVLFLRNARVSEDRQRALYSQGESIGDAWKKLRWVEGIVALFGDREWAENAYRDLEQGSDQPDYLEVLKNSRVRALNPDSL